MYLFRTRQVLFTILLCLYLTGLHNVSTVDQDGTENPRHAAKAVPLTFPTAPYLLQHVSKHITNALPGSIKSDAKTFEGTMETETGQRDSNLLPGAIDLLGAFDEHGTRKISDTHTTTETQYNSEKVLDTSPSKSVPSPQVPRQSHESEARQDIVAPSRTPALTALPLNETMSSGGSVKRRRRSRKLKKRRKTKARRSKAAAKNSDQDRSKRDSFEKEGKNVERPRQHKIQSSATQIFGGPRPMNRDMTELQVPGDTGILESSRIREYYGKLINAYLAPFREGISRDSFFEVLRRKTYSLSPPGSNKGIQTILFQLVDKKVFLMDPYEVTKNSKQFYKTRINELIWLLSDIAKGGAVPNTEFLVAIHDCVQTVDAEHTYRGAVYQESNPTFTIVSCNFSDNIPFPMWEGDAVRGGLKRWDEKMESYKKADTTSWEEKEERAVFRGGNRPSMYFTTKKEAEDNCENAGRSRLSYVGENHKDLFDVSVGGQWCGKYHKMLPLPEADHHRFKYILYTEGNCFWADRLNKQVFGPSAIIKQETPCGQFWEPLLKPMTHYIPTDFFFRDTVERIKWAKEHDPDVQAIVKNANDFASNFLSQESIKTYVKVLLNEYTKLLKSQEITPERGSRDVTI